MLAIKRRVDVVILLVKTLYIFCVPSVLMHFVVGLILLLLENGLIQILQCTFCR